MLDLYQLLLAFSVGGLFTFIIIKLSNRTTINYQFVVRFINDLAISIESFDAERGSMNVVSESLHRYPELLEGKKRIMQGIQRIILR